MHLVHCNVSPSHKALGGSVNSFNVMETFVFVKSMSQRYWSFFSTCVIRASICKHVRNYCVTIIMCSFNETCTLTAWRYFYFFPKCVWCLNVSMLTLMFVFLKIYVHTHTKWELSSPTLSPFLCLALTEWQRYKPITVNCRRGSVQWTFITQNHLEGFYRKRLKVL